MRDVSVACGNERALKLLAMSGFCRQARDTSPRLEQRERKMLVRRELAQRLCGFLVDRIGTDVDALQIRHPPEFRQSTIQPIETARLPCDDVALGILAEKPRESLFAKLQQLRFVLFALLSCAVVVHPAAGGQRQTTVSSNSERSRN